MKESGPRGRASVSSRRVAGIAAAAESLGVDVRASLERCRIDPAALADPDARIPVECEEALWEDVARASGDPYFGLHAQAHIAAGALDALDYAVRSSANLRAAWEVLVRCNRLAHDTAEFELLEEGDEARLVQRFRGRPDGPSWQVSPTTRSAAWSTSPVS